MLVCDEGGLIGITDKLVAGWVHLTLDIDFYHVFKYDTRR